MTEPRAVAGGPGALPEGLPRRESGLMRDTWRMLRRSASGQGGMILILLFGLVAVCAPALSPKDPLEQSIAHRLRPPSFANLLGTDELGRDVLSRLIFGSRLSLGVGVIAVLIAMLLGGLVGLAAGFQRGLLDNVLMRLMDIMMAFPSTLLAIAIVAFRGPGLFNTLLAIGVIRVPGFARLTRSVVLGIREQEFVSAARCMGGGTIRIVFHHVLPSAISPLIVQSTLGIGGAIVEAAGLGFLGLGAQPPTAEWGTMLSSSYIYILRAPWAMFGPALAIVLAVVAFNLFGDALRDALDPHMRS